MGYQITFTPTEEQMKKYKPWNEKEDPKSNEETIKTTVMEIINYCLKDQSSKSTYQIAKDIKFHLRFLAASIEKSEEYSAYQRWKDEDDHELWYCGWEFSHESRLNKDQLIEDYTDDLTMFAEVIPTADWYENRDKFYEKRDELKEQLDGFIDMIEDISIHKIIDNLKEMGAEKVYPEDEEKEE